MPASPRRTDPPSPGTPGTPPPAPAVPTAEGTSGRTAPSARRAEGIDAIQRELTAFSRRARAMASRIHPGLPLVSYTILEHLRDSGGCRGTDLATHFLLDKSTVSRQVSALEKLGLLSRSPDPEDQRGQILHPSAKGTALLEAAGEQRRQAFLDRLDDWSEEETVLFARLLERYNAGSGSAS